MPQDAAERERVDHILEAATRGAALTRQLLAFSRQQPMETRVLELADSVRGLEKMLRRLIGEDVEMVILCGAQATRVKADPSQIEQVIMNLALNARDAMPEGGRLIIETAPVELDASYALSHPDAKAGSHVQLAVSDSGTGISAEIINHIFEPFFTTKAPSKGTGLGLATVYGIARQSGGHVAVYTELGRGTTFKVYLPRVEAAADEQPAPVAAGPAAIVTETVLVLEDEEALRDVLEPEHVLDAGEIEAELRRQPLDQPQALDVGVRVEPRAARRAPGAHETLRLVQA